jgi:hypothetical protein
MPFGIFLGTLFFSLGLDKIIIYLIGKFSQINIFPLSPLGTIPGFSLELAQAKSIDIIEYGLFVLIAFISFAIILFLLHRRQQKQSFYDWFYLAVSLLFFAQVNFVGFSGSLSLIFFVLFQIIFWTVVLFRGNNRKIIFDLQLFINGIVVGLIMMQLIQKFNYSLIFPIFILMLIPLIYHLLPYKFLLNPSFIILSLFIFKPGNFDWLLILLIITVILLVLTELIKFKNKEKIFNLVYKIYPFILITLVAFNPLYYWATLDSIEEGFWLGWLQRLLNHEVMYRDFLAYHPPLIVWSLKYFILMFGASVANVKLFFHLIQIIAYFIFYLLIKKVINNKFGRVIILIMIMGISNGLTKNNVEIRLAMGLLPLIPLFNYLKSQKSWWLVLTGIFSGLSIFVSLEVGIVSLLSVGAYLIITKNIKLLKPLTNYVGGILIVFIPIFSVLIYQGALLNMIGQLTYYAKAFTDGYFNLAINRPKLSPLLDWRVVTNFFGSMEMWWQVSQIIIIGSFVFGVSKFFKEKKENPTNGIFTVLSLIALLMFRSALGRSDWWHLLSPLIIVFILFGYLVENFSQKATIVFAITLLTFAMILNRGSFSDYFIYNQVEKIQSYGKIPGTFISYKSPRFGIAVDQGIDIASTNNLVEYISDTSTDQKIFAYPWMPEIYFLTNKKNPTKVDTPYSFFTKDYQNQIIEELKKDEKVLIIYNSDMNFGGLDVNKLELLNNYLLDNYKTVEKFGKIEIKEINKTYY